MASLGKHRHSGGGRAPRAVVRSCSPSYRTLPTGSRRSFSTIRLVGSSGAMRLELVGLRAGWSQAGEDGSEQPGGGHVRPSLLGPHGESQGVQCRGRTLNQVGWYGAAAGREHGGTGVEGVLKVPLLEAIWVKPWCRGSSQCQLWKFPNGNRGLSRMWAGGFPSSTTEVPFLQVSDGRGVDYATCDCRGGGLAREVGQTEGWVGRLGASLQECAGTRQAEVRLAVQSSAPMRRSASGGRRWR